MALLFSDRAHSLWFLQGGGHCGCHLRLHSELSPDLAARVSSVHLRVLQVRHLGTLLGVSLRSHLSYLGSHSPWPVRPQHCPPTPVAFPDLTVRLGLSHGGRNIPAVHCTDCEMSGGLRFGIPTSLCDILLLKGSPGPDSPAGRQTFLRGGAAPLDTSTLLFRLGWRLAKKIIVTDK